MFRMFRNTTISEFKTTITEVPHENLPNTTIPQNFSMLRAKNVKLYDTLPSPNIPPWAIVPRGNANTKGGGHALN